MLRNNSRNSKTKSSQKSKSEGKMKRTQTHMPSRTVPTLLTLTLKRIHIRNSHPSHQQKPNLFFQQIVDFDPTPKANTRNPNLNQKKKNFSPTSTDSKFQLQTIKSKVITKNTSFSKDRTINSGQKYKEESIKLRDFA